MNSSRKDSHSQRDPSKAKSRSSFSLIHGPSAKDSVAKSNSQGMTSWKAACPVAIRIQEPITPPCRRQEQPQAQVPAHRLQLVAVDRGPHHIGRQHRHEIGGVGFDLRHPRREQQRKCHETRTACHHIDESRQKAAGKEQENLDDVQGGTRDVGVPYAGRRRVSASAVHPGKRGGKRRPKPPTLAPCGSSSPSSRSSRCSA